MAEDPQHTLELQLLDLEGQILQMDLQVAAIESRLGISRADEEG